MPEHTPNKQSKIDLSINDAVTPPSHEMSVSSYPLDSNEENYSINLERYCNASPFPDSGFESSCSLLAGQTPLSAYQPSKTAFPLNNQQQGSSACCLQKAVINKSSCPDMFAQRNGTDDKGPTAFQSFQDICSSSKYNGTWNGLTSSVNSWNSGQSGAQNQLADPFFDTGYSSHSTGSSNPCPDSQMERSYMDQGSQLDLETDVTGSASGNDIVKDNYLCGENELEDLLYHFRKYDI